MLSKAKNDYYMPYVEYIILWGWNIKSITNKGLLVIFSFPALLMSLTFSKLLYANLIMLFTLSSIETNLCL